MRLFLSFNFRPKFKWYALYAWGAPFIVTIVTVIMQVAQPHFNSSISLDSALLAF
jgi:hypothetical protein